MAANSHHENRCPDLVVSVVATAGTSGKKLND
jgi:hypothetical protein